jgi:23S rRNA (uracil1939-C5)-methyltransferase
VVLDPPRTGLDAALAAAVARVNAPIVYVSCDPNTLARDVKALGRRVTRAVPIDLMPQTYHVEVCVFLAAP